MLFYVEGVDSNFREHETCLSQTRYLGCLMVLYGIAHATSELVVTMKLPTHSRTPVVDQQ